MSEQPAVNTWSGRQRGNVLGHWIFHQLLRLAGRGIAGWVLYPVIAYYWLFAKTSRNVSRQYLARVKSYWNQIRGVNSFKHLLSFGHILLDRACLFSNTGGAYRFSYEGENYIREALAQGQGLILVSAHVGNWETAGSLLRQRVSSQFSVAMVRSEVTRLNAYLKKTQNAGLNMISLDDEDGSLKILSALRRGEVVAMQGDRFLPGARTQRLEFMGALAAFPEGPFQLAALAGCPIITCFSLRAGPRHYAFQAFPPERLSAHPEQRKKDVQAALQQYASRVEDVVRRMPLQWFNFYDFWA
jgi:predicted LPLAT superfamily acyltransferase